MGVIHIKRKKIKINQNQEGYYTLEEIIEIYDNYIKKQANAYYYYLNSHGAHNIYIGLEDFIQYIIIEIAKVYEMYDIDYKTETDPTFPEDEHMGFYPLMDSNVQGRLKRICRDALKKRRKDYNIHEISLTSFDAPIDTGNDDGKDITLLESVEIEDKDEFEDLHIKFEVEELLSCISEKERNIVVDLFLNNMTQINVGVKYGISQVQVSRIKDRAIKKMQKYGEANKEERNDNMKKPTIIKVNFRDLYDFLVTNVDNYSTLKKAISAYARENGLIEKDVHSSLESRQNSYEIIKNLYMDSKAIKELESKVTFKSTKKLKDEMKIDIKPASKPMGSNKVTSVVSTPVEKVEEAPVNIFKDLNVVSYNMVIDLDGMKGEFTSKGVKLLDMPTDFLSIEQLISLKNNIEKAIEISNTFNR